MARSGNDIPGGGGQKAVKPVLSGVQVRRIQSTRDTAQARGTNGSPARAFGVVLRLSGAIPVAFFRAIENRTGTRPVFSAVLDRSKIFDDSGLKNKVAEFGCDLTDARKRSKSDFV